MNSTASVWRTRRRCWRRSAACDLYMKRCPAGRKRLAAYAGGPICRALLRPISNESKRWSACRSPRLALARNVTNSYSAVKFTMDESRYAYHMDEPVASPPRRVVSLAPGVTESLFELNLAGPLIAVTAQCVYPEEGTARLAKIGDATSPNIHEIVELGPDLVIANTDENRREDIEALQDAGLTVWVTSPKTVRDVFNMLWNLMHVFDEP